MPKFDEYYWHFRANILWAIALVMLCAAAAGILPGCIAVLEGERPPDPHDSALHAYADVHDPHMIAPVRTERDTSTNFATDQYGSERREHRYFSRRPHCVLGRITARLLGDLPLIEYVTKASSGTTLTGSSCGAQMVAFPATSEPDWLRTNLLSSVCFGQH